MNPAERRPVARRSPLRPRPGARCPPRARSPARNSHGHESDRDAQERQRDHRAAHRRARIRVHAPPPRERGAPRNTTPHTLVKHASASAPVTPRRIAAGIAAHADGPRDNGGIEQPQVHQPLADETVERRKPADRHRAQGEQARRPRHPAPQAAQAAHFARAGRVKHGTGPEEQQRLEQPVIPHVQESARERKRAPGRMSMFHRDEREAETDQDDADVLDAVIREQSLEIVLAERERDPQHRARHAQASQPPSPRPIGDGQPAGEPHQSVDAHLDARRPT